MDPPVQGGGKGEVDAAPKEAMEDGLGDGAQGDSAKEMHKPSNAKEDCIKETDEPTSAKEDYTKETDESTSAKEDYTKETDESTSAKDDYTKETDEPTSEKEDCTKETDEPTSAKEDSVKETHRPPDPPIKPAKKIKPCRVSSSRHVPVPSPPPSPVGTPPPASPTSARGYSWDVLMRKPTFEAAPVECFKHAPLSQTWRNVCAGLKAEVVQRGVGKTTTTTYWVATLLQVQGYRGLFRPEGLGSDSTQDRWLELCSPDVKPVGWCAARGLPLTPPAAAGPAADWQKRLVSVLTGSRTLPPSFYRKVQASLSRGSQLTAGQTLEVVDKSCISQVRAARVTQQIGRRLHVHYLDAPEDDGGFWCHENSPLVHPVGWALAVGHRIEAPEEYLSRCESGQFLSTDATEDCLPAPPAVTHEGFKVGMKLEALDPLNLGSIGVATVRQTLGNHFMMVRMETDPDSDWFCYHAASPYIFPAGFCRTVGISLTPPHGYSRQADGNFQWEEYLRKEGAGAAPAHLFHRPPLSHGFQRGHKLEAVDLMDPQLVCVATVGAVVGRLLRIHFDGWEEQFDQWADAESPDLFPVGWCTLVGYPLEPPRAAEKIAPRRAAKRRSTGRRGRPRLRGTGGRRGAGRGITGGREAESESESMTGDGESVAESTHGGSRVSPTGTAVSEMDSVRYEFTPTPTPEPKPDRSWGATPEPRSTGATPEPRSTGPTPEPGAGPLPSTTQEPGTGVHAPMAPEPHDVTTPEPSAGSAPVPHSEQSSMVASEMPPEVPSQVPVEVPHEAPCEVPVEVPAQVSSEPTPAPPNAPETSAASDGALPMEVCEQKAPESGPAVQEAQGGAPETPEHPDPPSEVPMET